MFFTLNADGSDENEIIIIWKQKCKNISAEIFLPSTINDDISSHFAFLIMLSQYKEKKNKQKRTSAALPQNDL